MWRNYEFVSGFIVVVERRWHSNSAERSCERRNYGKATHICDESRHETTILMAHIEDVSTIKVMVRLNIHGPHSNYRVQFARRPIYQAWWRTWYLKLKICMMRVKEEYTSSFVDIQAVLKAWINSIKSFFRNVKLYRVLLQSQPPFWMVSEISNIRSNVGCWTLRDVRKWNLYPHQRWRHSWSGATSGSFWKSWRVM
jgi:hypothetical protein